MGDVLGTVGKIAGIGGIALGVFLLIFRDVIRRKIFSRLPAAETYRLLRLIIVLTFLIACLGVFAWIVGSEIQITLGSNSPIIGGSR
jgi:hypothetical protein